MSSESSLIHTYDKNLGIFISSQESDNSEPKLANGILFFDRDGVIIEERHYISRASDVKLIPGVKETFKYAKKHNFKVVIVTNQSGIARGLFDWDSYIDVTNRLMELLYAEAEIIDLILACPMHSMALKNQYKYESHQMRKPNPGMLNFAISRYGIPASKCIIVGDKLCDLKAGINAKLSELFHVKTGHGGEHRHAIIEYKKFTENANIYCIDSIKDLNDYLKQIKLQS